MFVIPASVSQFGFCFFGSNAGSALRASLALPVSAPLAVVAGSGVASVVCAVAEGSGGRAQVVPVGRGVFGRLASGAVLAPAAVCVVVCPSAAPLLSGGRFRGGSWSWALAVSRASAGLPSLLLLPRSLRLAPSVFAWLRSRGWSRLSSGVWACGL